MIVPALLVNKLLYVDVSTTSSWIFTRNLISTASVVFPEHLRNVNSLRPGSNRKTEMSPACSQEVIIK